MAVRGKRIVAVGLGRLRLLWRAFNGPILGVIMAFRDGTCYVALADDIAEADVAGALRHLTEAHADPGRPATICRAPACDAWQSWRQRDADIASTA